MTNRMQSGIRSNSKFTNKTSQKSRITRKLTQNNTKKKNVRLSILMALDYYKFGHTVRGATMLPLHEMLNKPHAIIHDRCQAIFLDHRVFRDHMLRNDCIPHDNDSELIDLDHLKECVLALNGPSQWPPRNYPTVKPVPRELPIMNVDSHASANGKRICLAAPVANITSTSTHNQHPMPLAQTPAPMRASNTSNLIPSAFNARPLMHEQQSMLQTHAPMRASHPSNLIPSAFNAAPLMHEQQSMSLSQTLAPHTQHPSPPLDTMRHPSTIEQDQSSTSTSSEDMIASRVECPICHKSFTTVSSLSRHLGYTGTKGKCGVQYMPSIYKWLHVLGEEITDDPAWTTDIKTCPAHLQTRYTKLTTYAKKTENAWIQFKMNTNLEEEKDRAPMLAKYHVDI